MASNPPGAPDEPWDQLRIEEELRKLRDHAEAVQRFTQSEPPRNGKTWTEKFAPWVVPALLTLALAAIGWAIHQHDVAGRLAEQYAAQNQTQDVKLAGMDVRMLALDQAIQLLRADVLVENHRIRDRLERLEQRR